MRHYRPEEITPDFLANLKYSDITPEELDEVIVVARRMYSADDLQRHLDRNDGISADEVLRDLKKAQKQFNAGRLA
jgi:hypothetical protein